MSAALFSVEIMISGSLLAADSSIPARILVPALCKAFDVLQRIDIASDRLI